MFLFFLCVTAFCVRKIMFFEVLDIASNEEESMSMGQIMPMQPLSVHRLYGFPLFSEELWKMKRGEDG